VSVRRFPHKFDGKTATAAGLPPEPAVEAAAPLPKMPGKKACQAWVTVEKVGHRDGFYEE